MNFEVNDVDAFIVLKLNGKLPLGEATEPNLRKRNVSAAKNCFWEILDSIVRFKYM